MEITLLAFASSSETFGFTKRQVDCAPTDTPLSIIRRIAPGANLECLRVALDDEFATWETPVGNARELAIIPPVSGG